MSGNSRLELAIHPSAVVALSSQISIETEVPISPAPSSPSQPPPSTADIKLIVAGGNLFHPHARLILIPPSSPPTDPPIGTSAAQPNGGEGKIVVRIGENNVFEEECRVVLDLRGVTKPAPGEEGRVVEIVGSYNQFAPRSRVRSNRIGNANIFQPMCHLGIPAIKNGNIFGSALRVDTIGGANDVCATDDAHDSAAATFFQEKVVYIVGGEKQQRVGAVNQQVVRPNVHGMKRNMRAVGLLLGAARSIVQKNHRLMAVTSDGSS